MHPAMATAQLAADGDAFEIRYADDFLRTRFPNYAVVWATYVLPRTNRALGTTDPQRRIQLRTDIDPNDAARVQLHYTTFDHLRHARELLTANRQGPISGEVLFDVIVRLCAATDVADELLGRVADSPNEADPFDFTRGKAIRSAWRFRDLSNPSMRKRRGEMLKVHHYRNRLIHGHLTPSITLVDVHGRQTVRAPKIGHEEKYLDWRTLSDAARRPAPEQVARDFDLARPIASYAWDRILDYLDQTWGHDLIPRLATLPGPLPTLMRFAPPDPDTYHTGGSAIVRYRDSS